MAFVSKNEYEKVILEGIQEYVDKNCFKIHEMFNRGETKLDPNDIEDLVDIIKDKINPNKQTILNYLNYTHNVIQLQVSSALGNMIVVEIHSSILLKVEILW